jgi:hypothetical protein
VPEPSVRAGEDATSTAPLIINGLTVRPRGTTKATDSWSPRQKTAVYVALFTPWEIALPFVTIALGIDSLLRWLDAMKDTDVS